VTLFAVNRSQDAALPIEADLRGFPGFRVAEHLVLEHADPNAINTIDRPETVTPHNRGDATVNSNRLMASLPAISWNVIRLAPAPTS